MESERNEGGRNETDKSEMHIVCWRLAITIYRALALVQCAK